jgi:hypothetical protein
VRRVNRLLKRRAENKTDLAQAGGKYHHLVDLAHLLQKVVDAWALDDVHVMPMVLDLHWHDVIRVLYGLQDGG